MLWLNKVRSTVFVAVSASLLCVSLCSLAFAEGHEQPTSSISDQEIAELLAPMPSPASGIDTLDVSQIQEYSGSDRYETNALQAKGGWTTSEWAIVTTGENWADALAASGLAGALDCPILLTMPGNLPNVTLDALNALKVEKVVILGGEGAVSLNVEQELWNAGVTVEARLYGQDRYETQMEIFEYGLDKGLWSPGYVVVACGADGCFADALSISPVAYAETMPIFLTNANGELNPKQKALLAESVNEGLVTSSVLLGGPTRVSGATEGFMWGIAQLSTGKSKEAHRIAGLDRYETSALIAEWASSMGYIDFNGSAFASGATPYDSLGGGVLQGKVRSALFLVDEGECSDALSLLSDSHQVNAVKFFGGTGVVSENTRNQITASLGIHVLDIAVREYSVTLKRAVEVEQLSSSHSFDDLLAKIDPQSWTPTDPGYLQFAVLSEGYSGVVTENQLDTYIETMVAYQESSNGVSSTLRGMGSSIVAASREYGVNEIYLLSHAAIESAWGTSTLAQGFVYDGKTEIEGKTYPAGTYYNFFGIGAYDSSPLSGGRSMAVRNGWNSPEAAITGGAEWISKNYINPTVSSASVSGAQDTLYKMRWDVARIEKQGACWHQYASSLTWAEGIARVMSNAYSSLGLSLAETGLSYEVPSFLSEQ